MYASCKHLLQIAFQPSFSLEIGTTCRFAETKSVIFTTVLLKSDMKIIVIK